MIHCEHAQERLLDSLYGLLEPAGEEALRVHLEQCASCQAMVAKAEEQRRLLARAAQVCATVPLFSAPAELPAAIEPEPVIVPLPATPAPSVATTGRRSMRRLAVVTAVAAALLLAAAGLWGYYRSNVGERATELADARRQVNDVDGRITQAQQDYQREKDKLPGQVERRFMRLEVAGPATVTADSPTPIRMMTRDVLGKPAPARLTIRQIAGTQELYRKELTSDGDRAITLPAGLRQTGDAKLLVEARADDAVARVEETIKLEAPGHMAHLALSKSMLQVGEVLFFRALVLQSFSMRLPEQPLPVQFSLLDTQGKVVKQFTTATGSGGIATGELPLTQDLVSGTYALEVKGAGPASAMQPQRRQLEVLRDLPPQLQFDRQEYRAGETLTAQFKGRRGAGGQAIPNQDLRVKIMVDGKEVKVEGAEQSFAAPGGAATLRTDAAGNAAFRAKLPANIETGKAQVEIQSRAGKKQDKLVQSIPVVASRLSVDFFPEGGHLVAGVPNRVYYRVRTPLGEPVDPEGYVIILSSKDVVLASERNQGLGVFTFTPDARDGYTLRVTSSRGIVETANPFEKLGIRDNGVALHVPEPVTVESKPLRIVLRNTGESRRLLVVASCRGRIVAQEFVAAGQGSHELRLDPVAGARGVVRVTVYDAGGPALLPLAERLVYRAPAEKLVLAAPLDKKTFRPGERVTLRLLATDEKGKAPTWFLASVVDERALGVFDQAAAGPAASFCLLSEVRQAQDLDNADLLLLDGDRARQDLDLFLGTQGWRRFVPAEPALLANRGAADAGMLLFCRESSSPAELQARRTEAVHAELARLRRDYVGATASLEDERASAVTRATLAARELAEFQARPAELLRLGLGVLVLLLIATGVIALCLGLIRGLRRSASPTTAFASAFGCLLACLVLYAVSGSLPDHSRLDPPTGMTAAPRNRLVPDAENQQANPPAMVARATPLGLFALAPLAGGADTKVEHERRPVRTAAKDMFAKADGDKNRDATSAPPVSILMKQRFIELQREPQRHEATDPSAAKKSNAVKGGFGTNESKKVTVNMVREYRYWANGPRTAAEATLFWHPALFAADGKASLSFDLPATAASYRILIYGHDANGRLGQLRQALDAR